MPRTKDEDDETFYPDQDVEYGRALDALVKAVSGSLVCPLGTTHDFDDIICCWKKGAIFQDHVLKYEVF